MDRQATRRALPAGSRVRVKLDKAGPRTVEYAAVVTFDDGVHIIVQGFWAEAAARDLGFVRFEPGDRFTEHYWRDRWYSIKQVHSERGALKGWYCDVARPVWIRGSLLVSEDLDLDLWVSADGQTTLRLDEDDFIASGLADRDPGAAAAARQALDELERLADGRFQEIVGSGREATSIQPSDPAGR